MKRSPAALYRRPPSPRTASEMRKERPPTESPCHRLVGWNCTNSMLAIAALARCAMAMPSPVVTLGLVVFGYTCATSNLVSTSAAT